MTELTPKKESIVFLGMIVVLVIPAFLALRTVQIPGELRYSSDVTAISDAVVAEDHQKQSGKYNPHNPTPYGYTWSLLIFFTPTLMIAICFKSIFQNKIVRKALMLTIGGLFPIGFLLDLVLGNLFFDFPNQGATLGIHLPGYDFEKGAWIWDLPIEEFFFYNTGFNAIIAIYVWCDEYWFEAYNVRHYDKDPIATASRNKGIIKSLHIPSIIMGVILVIGAVLYKKFGTHPHQNGFPGYFTFLVAISVVPSTALFNIAYPHINWRAFSATFFYVLMISMMWEATLASPYGWWRYNNDQMMGLVINAWSGLPVEAAMLWLSITFTTTIIYTTIKVWLHSGKSFRKFFLG